MKYCSECGNQLTSNSKFCSICGKKVQSDEILKVSTKSKKTELSNNADDLPSHPYVISTVKLVILSITSLGLYEIYWFYKHFKSFKEENSWDITPWARAVFAPLMAHSLFIEVRESVKKVDDHKTLSAGLLAGLYFLFNIFWRLPGLYWLLSFLTIIPLIQVQNVINFYWAKKYNDRIPEVKFNVWNYLIAVIGSILLLLAILGSLEEETDYTYSDTTTGFGSVTRSASDLNSDYKRNFINECIKSEGASYSYCTCAIDYLQERYSYDQLVEIDSRYSRTNVIPTELNDAIESCSYLAE